MNPLSFLAQISPRYKNDFSVESTSVLRFLSFLLVIVVAFGCVLYWGRIGFAFFDQSFFVDASYRLLNGQRMYVDFWGLSHGPLTYYLQALFFKIFGEVQPDLRGHSYRFHGALSQPVMSHQK